VQEQHDRLPRDQVVPDEDRLVIAVDDLLHERLEHATSLPLAAAAAA
jgi:hypothetical protein